MHPHAYAWRCWAGPRARERLPTHLWVWACRRVVGTESKFRITSVVPAVGLYACRLFLFVACRLFLFVSRCNCNCLKWRPLASCVRLSLLRCWDSKVTSALSLACSLFLYAPTDAACYFVDCARLVPSALAFLVQEPQRMQNFQFRFRRSALRTRLHHVVVVLGFCVEHVLANASVVNLRCPVYWGLPVLSSV